MSPRININNTGVNIVYLLGSILKQRYFNLECLLESTLLEVCVNAPAMIFINCCLPVRVNSKAALFPRLSARINVHTKLCQRCAPGRSTCKPSTNLCQHCAVVCLP